MPDPKKDRPPEHLPDVPDAERANEAFLDTLIDTDGRPNRDAEAIVEIEDGEDEDD